MRFNDREIAKLGEGTPDLEGILSHMKPQGKDWSDWYQQPQFKDREFKLFSNLLFYYKISEPEPLGVLVLENAQIAYESPHKSFNFAFSITFKVNEKYPNNDSKHIFSCRCQDDVNKWVSALKKASYEYWRSQYVILKTKLSMKTGKDPILDYVKSQHFNHPVQNKEPKKTKVKGCKSSFYSHIESSMFYQSTSYSSSKTVTQNNTIDNLIEL